MPFSHSHRISPYEGTGKSNPRRFRDVAEGSARNGSISALLAREMEYLRCDALLVLTGGERLFNGDARGRVRGFWVHV